MSLNTAIPNFQGQNLIKVLRNESYTVPESKTISSPAGASSGVSPTTTFSSVGRSVGGAIFAAFSDAAGPTTEDLQYPLAPGDVVAVSNAAAPAVVTVNGVEIFRITNTNIAGVLLYWS